MLVLIAALGLNHQYSMIEEENLKFRAFALGSASLLERTFVDEVSRLVPELQINRLARLENQLLIQLSEIKSCFRPT